MAKSAVAETIEKTKTLNDRVSHFEGCPATADGTVEGEDRLETYPASSPKRGTVQVTRCRECGAQTIEEEQ